MKYQVVHIPEESTRFLRKEYWCIVYIIKNNTESPYRYRQAFKARFASHLEAQEIVDQLNILCLP